jgi:hypothetical protein
MKKSESEKNTIISKGFAKADVIEIITYILYGIGGLCLLPALDPDNRVYFLSIAAGLGLLGWVLSCYVSNIRVQCVIAENTMKQDNN